MRIKIFMDSDPSKLEEQINHWFAHDAGTPLVEKTETVLTALGQDWKIVPLYRHDDLVSAVNDRQRSTCVIVTGRTADPHIAALGFAHSARQKS
jgi:hypothetical protein